MPDINGIPYVDSTDLVSAYPTVSQALAQEVSDQLASKVDYPSGGANGDTLTKSGTTTAWATSSGTVLATGSLSGSSIAINSIPQTYRDLQLLIRNFRPGTDDTTIRFQFNSDSNANRHGGENNNQQNRPFGGTSGAINWGNDNSVANGLIVATVFDYTNATTWKWLSYGAIDTNATTTTNYNWTQGVVLYNQTAAVTSITLLPGTGTFTSGTYSLIGVK